MLKQEAKEKKKIGKSRSRINTCTSCSKGLCHCFTGGESLMLTEGMSSHGFFSPVQSQGYLKLSILYSVMLYKHWKGAYHTRTKEHPGQKLIWGKRHFGEKEPKYMGGGAEDSKNIRISRELIANFRSIKRHCTVELQTPADVRRSYSGKGPYWTN